LAPAPISKLPKAEHTAPEWQAAMEALILVATLGGPTMFARIGIMRALNRPPSGFSIHREGDWDVASWRATNSGTPTA
jgi:pilus assembly protein Flp/PilA